MAGTMDIDGWGKEIGVVVEPKLLKRHSNHIENLTMMLFNKGKAKVIPLQTRCGPEGGQRYSSTLT